MAVEPRTLVARGDPWEPVGRLEAELVREPDVHVRDAPSTMYIVLSKKPRKTNRSKSKRFRAKLKAKDRARRGRVYQVGKN
jgi:hypothetical protein